MNIVEISYIKGRFVSPSIHLSISWHNWQGCDCTYLHLTSFLVVGVDRCPVSHSGWFLFWKEVDRGWREAWQWAATLFFAPQEVHALRVEVNSRISQFFCVCVFFFLPSQKQLCNDFGRRRAVKSKAMERDGPLPWNCLIKPLESTGCMGTMAKWVAGSCACVLPHE